MAETENKSSAFLKWIGGIAASVITAVLVYYLTRPAPPPTPPVAQTEMDGYVADSVSQKLVRNASVTVRLGQNSVHQLTDQSGRYSVVLASTGSEPNMGSVDVRASGYADYSNTVPLRPGENFAEILIDEIPPSSAAAPPREPTLGGSPAGARPEPPLERPAVARAQIIFKAPPSNWTKATTAYAGVPHK
jgi:hypothetical protein